MGTVTTLVKAVQAGEQDAFTTLVRRFQDMAVGYGYSLVGDRQLAEDVAQEAFLAAYLHLPTLRRPAAFPGWLRRIVERQAHQVRRRQLDCLPLEEVANCPATTPEPAVLAEQGEVREQLAAALAALPEAQRGVVALFYISDYSLQEISTFLGIPVGTVKSRLHTARERLKARTLTLIQETLPAYRPSRDEQFVKELIMELTWGIALSCATAGCRVQLVEDAQIIETRYAQPVQDNIKIRPGQLVVVDQSVTPPETVWRLFHMQITALTEDEAVLWDTARGGEKRVPLPALIEQPLRPGDAVWAGINQVCDRVVEGKPAHPTALLAALKPTIVATYENIVKHEPDSAAALTVRGNHWLDNGDYTQAIATYDRALQVDGGYGLAYGYRGLANSLIGETKRAKVDYQKALALLENAGQRRWIEDRLANLPQV
ncbi:MAG: sigma-70 family RNA polymerase sigma factor [Caldilineaceae bacterium]